MRVLVCGSIGYGGVDEIRDIQAFLRSEGFEVIDQLDVDYSDVDDFRDKPDLCRKIVEHDLHLCQEADVIVLVASYPSFGAAVEAALASMTGKPVVSYCPTQLKSPWPLYLSRSVVTSKSELVGVLRSLNVEKIRTIPNVYGRHEATFVYDDFRCVCPVTGLEDRATIKIRYVPREKLIEYESLDAYFKTFAGKEMHHEAVVSRIFSDVMKSVEPEKLEIVAEFERRSGVRAVVRISRGY